MDKDETVALIDFAGGDSEFARLLGIDGDDGHQQRVNNWKRRGMPAAVVLEHFEVIRDLQAKVARQQKSLV